MEYSPKKSDPIQKELLKKENIYKLISENMQDMICLHEVDGTYMYVSPSVKELLGYTPEELLGKNPYDYFHPDDIQRITHEAHEKATTGDPQIVISYRIRKKDGSYIWFETLTKPIMNEQGAVINLQTASRDITSWVETEQEKAVLAKFPDENPNPVIRVTDNNNVLYANKSSLNLDSLFENSAHERLPDFWETVIDEVLESQTPQKIELTLNDKIFLFSVTPVLDLKEVYIYGIDISDKRKTEKELNLTSKIFETTIEGIVVTSPDGTIESVNPAFTKITGYSKEEALGNNPRILKSERHEKAFYKELWDTLIEKGVWEGEIWNRRKNGETYPEWLSVNAIKNDFGQVEHYVAVFNDITDIKIKEAEIEYHAFHDPLTGLPNRTLLEDRVSQAISHAKRNDLRMGLIFIDLDRFKIINDSLGHIFGDYLLQKVAKRLVKCIRDEDTVSRVGGDEFVILLPEIESHNDVSCISDRIIEAFNEVYVIKDKELFVTPSLGLTVYPDDGDNLIELYKNADMAMYDSKKNGGNKYHFYSDHMNTEVNKRLELENKLRKVIESEKFMIYFQPIVDAQTYSVYGAELLLRWQDADFGFVSPSEFIPLTEETGLITGITEWLIDKSFEYHNELKKDFNKEIHFSLNITAHQFNNNIILENIEKAKNAFNISPEFLNLEITENSLMKNQDDIINLMNEVKKTGVTFAIDDFGTGYSSLSYLKKFPLDFLKIDKSFVSDIMKDPEDMEIIKAIIDLGKGLNLKLVSEGVETREQLTFLQANGCDYIQGYLFSKPVTFDEYKNIFINKKISI